ncbi:MAG: ATP-dependent Clp protease adaptor ClpS [Planctomycetes bacterium]|nr:ATP-dependent Clp protease adaptor ClpS [Planctomycetota bacterium]
MPQAIEEPKTQETVELQRPWNVVLFNDDVHTFDEVILQLQKATGCSLERAVQITYAAHTEGQAVAYGGCLERCEIVAAKLQEIRLRVTIERG